MIFSYDLGKWVLSTIVQSEAALLGLNFAGISIASAFLYRSGQFYKSPDKVFKNNYKNFKNLQICSYVMGGFTILFSLISLLFLESFIVEAIKVLSIIASISLIICAGCTILSIIIFLKVISDHVTFQS